MFSKACEYGIRSLIFITNQSLQERRVNIKDISKAIDSPTAFTGKILQKLVRANIVESIRGPRGGFYIEPKKLNTIKLAQVVEAIDGDKIYNGCGLGLKTCNEKRPCPMHFHFKEIRNSLKQMLSTTTLFHLSEHIEDGTGFLRL